MNPGGRSRVRFRSYSGRHQQSSYLGDTFARDDEPHARKALCFWCGAHSQRQDPATRATYQLERGSLHRRPFCGRSGLGTAHMSSPGQGKIPYELGLGRKGVRVTGHKGL